MFVFTDVYVFHRHCDNKTDIAREIVDKDLKLLTQQV